LSSLGGLTRAVDTPRAPSALDWFLPIKLTVDSRRGTCVGWTGVACGRSAGILPASDAAGWCGQWP